MPCQLFLCHLVGLQNRADKYHAIYEQEDWRHKGEIFQGCLLPESKLSTTILASQT